MVVFEFISDNFVLVRLFFSVWENRHLETVCHLDRYTQVLSRAYTKTLSGIFHHIPFHNY